MHFCTILIEQMILSTGILSWKDFYSSFFVSLFIITMYCYILWLLFDMIDMVTSYIGFTF